MTGKEGEKGEREEKVEDERGLGVGEGIREWGEGHMVRDELPLEYSVLLEV